MITQGLTQYVQFLIEHDSVLKAPPLAIAPAEAALMCAGFIVGVNLQSLAEYVLIQFAYSLTAFSLVAALVLHHLAIAILDITNVHSSKHSTGLTVLPFCARLHAQQVVRLQDKVAVEETLSRRLNIPQLRVELLQLGVLRHEGLPCLGTSMCLSDTICVMSTLSD